MYLVCERTFRPQVMMTCRFGPLNAFLLTSPIGDLKLSCCSKAVHSLSRCQPADENSFRPDTKVDVALKDKISSGNQGSSHEIVEQCVNWLQNYFHGQTLGASPVICHLMDSSCKDDTFTKRVWRALAEQVPIGRTVSYGQLAELAGSSSKASRAVGQAMRTNPVMILVPCHRVLLGSGAIGSYSGGGSAVKSWLLQHEGRTNEV